MEFHIGQTFQLYVTYVDTEGPYLKIIGQADKEDSLLIESLIRNSRDRFNSGIGLVPAMALHVGFVCIAKYTDGTFYRAKVTDINSVASGLVLVYFIDYGNSEVISVTAIRHMDGFPERLSTTKPLASEYLLSRVMNMKGMWNEKMLWKLRSLIANQEIICKIEHSTCGRLFAGMLFQNLDLSSYLASEGYVSEVPVEKQGYLLQKMIEQTTPSSSSQVLVNTSSTLGGSGAGNPKSFQSMQFVNSDQVSNVKDSSQNNKNKLARNVLPPRPLNRIHSKSPEIYHPPHSPNYRDANRNPRSSSSPVKSSRSNPSTYRGRLLEINSEHQVLVSYAKDGPKLFAIQLQSDKDVLESIVISINKLPPKTLVEPPIIGSVCLGRFSEDKTLCRAVVMGLTNDRCKLFFVDFGMTELVSYYNIFYIPEEFVTPYVFSLRFCLSGIKDLKITDEINNEFYKIVHNKVLTLKVVTPEGPPLIQYGELYLNNLNVKNMLMQMQDPKSFTFKRIQPSSVHGEHSVLVSFVDSCTKFFVQLSENVEDLNTVMKNVKDYCSTAKPLMFHEVKTGMPCCALFPDDNVWYRAQVTNIRKDKITVNYVDYGNEQEVTANFLRPINTALVRLECQAIHCALFGFENKPFDQDISDNLEALTLEKILCMSVHKTLPGGVLLVDLVDQSCSPTMDIAKNVLSFSKTVDETQSSQQVKSEAIKESPRRKQKSSPEINPQISPDSRNNFYERKYSDKKRNNDAENKKNERKFDSEGKNLKSPENYSLNKCDRKSNTGQGASKAPQQSHENSRKKKISDQYQHAPSSHANSRQQRDKESRFNKIKENESHKKYEDEKSKPYGKRFGSDCGDSDYKNLHSKYPEPHSKYPEPHAKQKVIAEKFLDNPVSIDTPYAEYNLDAGSVFEVKVTWFINPNEFYVQILTQQMEFETMMLSIPSLYTGVKKLTDVVSPGVTVLARFPEDKVLYRAQVAKLTSNGKIIVQFVDFGNKCIVDKTDLWQLDSGLMKLPKLAVKCSLSGILSLDGKWTQNPQIDDCFKSPSYKCTFESVDANGIHIVSLASDNGSEVSQQLVEHNLACVNSPLPNENLDDLASDEPIDFSYLIGQEIEVRICHVQSMDKFFLQMDLNKADKILAIVNAYENLQTIPLKSVGNGVHCLSENSKGELVRAIILDCSNKEKVRIVCPDFGYECEVSIKKLRMLPADLAAYFYLSYISKLKNYEEGQSEKLITDKDFVSKLNGNRFIAYIDDVVEGMLYITLFEKETGSIINIFRPNKGTFSSLSVISPFPVYSKNFGQASVSHIETFDSIFLQSIKNVDILAILLKKLFVFYEDEAHKEVLSSANIDTLCVAKSTDGNWYRAKILEVLTNKYEILYVDYGNTEVIPMADIRPLDSQFLLPHQLSLCVKLDVTPLSVEALLELKNIVDGNIVNTILDISDDGWVCNMTIGNENILNMLIKEHLVEVNQAVKNVETFTPKASTALVAPCTRSSVLVSHIDSPGQFWLQMFSDLDSISSLQQKIQSATSFENLMNCEVGKSCVAMYSANEQYYRAIILDADNDITTVRFIDYGNTDVLDNSPGVLKCLPSEWQEIQPYAMKCSVNATPTGTGQWTEQASELFIQLLGNRQNPVDADFVLKDTTTYVDLYVNDKNVTEKLVEAGFAKPAEKLNEGEMPTCFASHVNSPSEFWIQLESAILDLEAVSEELINANEFPPLAEIEEEVVCAAQFPEDGSWYRAQVIIHGMEGTEVLFMDYGNASLTNELRSLPEALKVMPALSRKCALQKPSDIKNWSKEAEIKFADMAADGATTFHVCFIASGDISIVELYVNGSSVTEDLVSLCEVQMNAEKPPIHEEKMVSVHCSHCNCPEDFWVQSNNSDEIDMITKTLLDGEKLEPLENIEEGASCVSLFPEDGLWYRSLILDRGESGTEVIHIDYGTKSVTTDLRITPTNLTNIPPLAKHCSLLLPPNKVKWSVKFHEKFAESMLESKNLHIEEINSDIQPIIVKLFLDGEDIIHKLDESNESESLKSDRTEPFETSTENPNETVEVKTSPDKIELNENVIIQCESEKMDVFAIKHNMEGEEENLKDLKIHFESSVIEVNVEKSTSISNQMDGSGTIQFQNDEESEVNVMLNKVDDFHSIEKREESEVDVMLNKVDDFHSTEKREESEVDVMLNKVDDFHSIEKREESEVDVMLNKVDDFHSTEKREDLDVTDNSKIFEKLNLNTSEETSSSVQNISVNDVKVADEDCLSDNLITNEKKENTEEDSTSGLDTNDEKQNAKKDSKVPDDLESSESLDLHLNENQNVEDSNSSHDLTSTTVHKLNVKTVKESLDSGLSVSEETKCSEQDVENINKNENTEKSEHVDVKTKKPDLEDFKEQ